jgi:hypothetical protein
MVLELHTYVSPPGRRAALVERFQSGTFAIFERLGIELVAMYLDRVEPDRLYYITRFPDEEARVAAWAAFAADPEWQAHKQASERDGLILSFRTRALLDPVVENG